mmetsp:Transcript_56281/g.85154  ORF Transcript_56281/g.85154 Transcript_56281/m.85154 type:complete len:206 (-) Transcript_56281:202-819(-)
MGVSNTSFPSPGLKSKGTKLARKKQQNAKVRKPVVHFNDDVSIEVVQRHAVESKPSLWWTREERRDIAEKNQQLAQEFKDYHEDKVEHCNDVFDQCCSDVSASSSDYLEQAKVEVPALVRGLEWGFLPSAKAYRRTHCQQVLEAQTQVQNLPNEDMKYRLLSSRAIRSSRPSRVMARILGECDAAATKDKPMLGRNRCRMIPSWW